MAIYLDFFLIAKSKLLTIWRDEIKRNPTAPGLGELTDKRTARAVELSVL